MVAATVVAALGTILVLLYVRQADERAQERFETTPVLRATSVVAAGESIDGALSSGKVVVEDVVRDAVLDGALSDSSPISGMVALSPIYPGEQIIAERFGESASTGPDLLIPGGGKMAVSVNLTDPARVAGFVNPGSEVAVFLNGTEAATGQPFTRVLLERVSVLGVGSTTPVSTTTTEAGGAQTVEQLPRTLITLSLNQRQAERVLFAQANGELAFALLTEDSKITPAPAVTNRNLFG
ncbi:Flp pilus assembly protein CpaB [Nocardioides sp. zg-DK7169]|uniref:Flp pilus assembly protein CpaB n=1 Tax=Nocardioides sp. zg-DK7169 TaxID=2736600 RepID=UPI0015518E2E|nr:Flp pilus assembly protein CpaB [Nocardioides sp. zg-DK7169]NPC95444.1 Flp pilus assembly protein CpaB [Nocardioides sp. zg-DK7169]